MDNDAIEIRMEHADAASEARHAASSAFTKGNNYAAGAHNYPENRKTGANTGNPNPTSCPFAKGNTAAQKHHISAIKRDFLSMKCAKMPTWRKWEELEEGGDMKVNVNL